MELKLAVSINVARTANSINSLGKYDSLPSTNKAAVEEIILLW